MGRENEDTIRSERERRDLRRYPAGTARPVAGSSTPQDLPPMTDHDFLGLSRLIQEKCGIYLQPAKKYLLEGRLKKRLLHLKLATYGQYFTYLRSHQGIQEELVSLIDAVTTNKTDFFREAHQFDFLVRSALPQWMEENQEKSGSLCHLWSAACSTGEEPYSLAIYLEEFTAGHPGFHYQILATDISSRVLEEAIRGVYAHDKIEPIPLPLRKKYLLRSKDPNQDVVKIDPGVQKKVTFRHLNLMENSFGITHPVHFLFCRNVIIYFDKSTQLALLHRLCQQLAPRGYLFMGHSEVLSNTDLPLTAVGPSIYRKI